MNTMDADIKNIIDAEERFLGALNEAEIAARARIEKRRSELISFRDSEFERIKSENSERTQLGINEIRSNADKELEELKRNEERFLDDPEIRREITGRIVSVILE